ncbi:MAG: hypothetical protein EXQ89_03590 [Rhodospirillaceae bacterium]|nr:hypothetical protein [Rhodospirillaceae bacterium]
MSLAESMARSQQQQIGAGSANNRFCYAPQGRTAYEIISGSCVAGDFEISAPPARAAMWCYDQALNNAYPSGAGASCVGNDLKVTEIDARLRLRATNATKWCHDPAKDVVYTVSAVCFGGDRLLTEAEGRARQDLNAARVNPAPFVSASDWCLGYGRELGFVADSGGCADNDRTQAEANRRLQLIQC